MQWAAIWNVRIQLRGARQLSFLLFITLFVGALGMGSTQSFPLGDTVALLYSRGGI